MGADLTAREMRWSIALQHSGKVARRQLSELDKILLHSAHDVYIPLSPPSLSKPVPVLQFFFALQAAKKG